MSDHEPFDVFAITPMVLRMVLDARHQVEALRKRYGDVLPTCLRRWEEQIDGVLAEHADVIDHILDEAYDVHGKLWEQDRDEIGEAIIAARDMR